MVYVTGDTHGDMARFDSPQVRKLRKGDTLIICGDFGFLWDGSKKEERNIHKLGKKKYHVLFVDGSHENFDLLEKYPVEDYCGGKARHLGGNLYHLLRGQVYELEGKKYFAFGGGESDEKQLYIEAGKWWERETPDLAEMRDAVENLNAADFKVDYVVTHEPAPGIINQRASTQNKAKQLDVFFEELSKRMQYQKWFFGSIHMDRKVTAKNYAVFSAVVPVDKAVKG